MTEMSDLDRLQQQLTKMGSAVRYPPTPDLAVGFWRRLEAAPRHGRLSGRLAFGAAALVAVVSAASVAIALVAPARDAAADLFHSLNIFETDQPTEGLPTDITGRETTLGDTESALGTHISLPTYPGIARAQASVAARLRAGEGRRALLRG